MACDLPEEKTVKAGSCSNKEREKVLQEEES